MYTHLSWLCLCSILGAGRMVQGALLDAPSVKNFGRRSMATATVIGDFVYVDGGELTQLEDGRGSLIRAVMNSTLSIDMSKSWNSSTVTVNVISKPNGVPSRSRANIWVNAAAGEFYSWGGSHPDGKNIAEAQVWKFTANGNGGGTWSVQNLENPDILKKIHPTRGGAFANSDDTGFLIGGQTHERTELGRKDLQNIPGMLTFDMKTKVMENVTKDEFPAGSPFEGSLVSAEAHFIPNFGPNGLIMVFGGHSAPLDNKIDAHQAKAFDMETLWFFDPKTREKFSQKSTGTPPPVPRVNFCVAGFQTEDGYDIFLYGGFNDQGSKPIHMDAYILSLPGFVWIKVPDSSIIGPRQDQACVSVGKRQVLNIGGGPLGWTSQDDAPQGFAVFDMTTLEWRYSYDANAGPYERTDTLKEWYNKSSLSSIQWSSEKVKGLFATSSPKPTETSDVESKKPPAAGAIAGGVIGGVAFLAIVLAIAWWFLVRPRRRNHLNGETVGPEAKPLSYKYWNAQEVSGYQGIMELPAVERGRTELPVGTERVELPGTNEYHGLR